MVVTDVYHSCGLVSLVKDGELKGAQGSESEICSVMSNVLRPHELYSSWNSPDQNAGVGSLSLPQGIFPTQGSNPGFLHGRQILNQLSHKGSSLKVEGKPKRKIFKWA